MKVFPPRWPENWSAQTHNWKGKGGEVFSVYFSISLWKSCTHTSQWENCMQAFPPVKRQPLPPMQHNQIARKSLIRPKNWPFMSTEIIYIILYTSKEAFVQHFSTVLFWFCWVFWGVCFFVGFFLWDEILVRKSCRSRKVTDGCWSHATEKAVADRICYPFTAADKTLTV